MRYTVIFSAEAEYDISKIFEYIMIKLKSPKAAVNKINMLKKQIVSLENMPNRYKIYDKEPWKSRGLRIMPVDNYNVFYIAEEDIRKVSIIRILYQRRDTQSQIHEEEADYKVYAGE